ncbi:DUF6247 family protein [Actinomadura alba]|uniref:Uncharacterized protein n=1 Tax=Actinomadura alba TaxID=406431 RepID=A0ABR7LPT4_9ACTN|nr:DUF6247 family protein [Actinomadura alba]MBC6466683.1 hypothetical protein [Actinomadura alba]
MTSVPEPVTQDPLALARRLNTERSPRIIREALPADQRAKFDDQYRKALAEAAEVYDLTGVHTLIERWLGVAMLHATGRYEAIMATVEAVRAGEVAVAPVDVGRLRALADERG